MIGNPAFAILMLQVAVDIIENHIALFELAIIRPPEARIFIRARLREIVGGGFSNNEFAESLRGRKCHDMAIAFQTAPVNRKVHLTHLIRIEIDPLLLVARQGFGFAEILPVAGVMAGDAGLTVEVVSRPGGTPLTRSSVSCRILQRFPNDGFVENDFR